MNLHLEIRRNSDGAVASVVWKDWDFNTYWWEEGNAACDCNRERFFLNALGMDVPDKSPCSEGRYSVRCLDEDNGTVLYDEITTEALDVL